MVLRPNPRTRILPRTVPARGDVRLAPDLLAGAGRVRGGAGVGEHRSEDRARDADRRRGRGEVDRQALVAEHRDRRDRRRPAGDEHRRRGDGREPMPRRRCARGLRGLEGGPARERPAERSRRHEDRGPDAEALEHRRDEEREPEGVALRGREGEDRDRHVPGDERPGHDREGDVAEQRPGEAHGCRHCSATPSPGRFPGTPYKPRHAMSRIPMGNPGRGPTWRVRKAENGPLIKGFALNSPMGS